MILNIGYFADGINLQQDFTVIFSADVDSDVSNKIYRVDIVDQDDSSITDSIINLVEIASVSDGDCVLSTLGAKYPAVIVILGTPFSSLINIRIILSTVTG